MILGLLSPVAALFVVGVGYGRLVRRIAERRQQKLAESVQRAEERLSGIRTVRTFNAERRELKGSVTCRETLTLNSKTVFVALRKVHDMFGGYQVSGPFNYVQ